MKLKFKFLNRTFSIVLCVALMLTVFPQTAYVAAESNTEKINESYNLNFVVGVDGDFGSWLKDKMNNYPRSKITFSSFRPGTEKFWKMEGGEYALLSSANFSNATAGKYIVKKEYYTGAGQLCATSTAALNVKWLNRIQFVRTGMYEGTFGVDVTSMSGVTTSNVTTYDVEYDTTRFIKFTPVVPDGYYVKSVTVNDNSYTIETTEGTGIYTLAPQTGNLGNITISPTITIEYAVIEGATIEGPAAPTLAGGDTDQKQQTFTLPSDLRWAESLEITATGGVNNSINKTQKFTNITAGSTITMTLDDEIVRGPVTYSFKYGSSQVNYKSVPTKSRTYWQTLSEPSLSVNTFEYTGKPIKPVDKLTGVEAGTYTVAYLSMLTMVINGNTGYARPEAVGDFTKLTTDNDIEYWFIPGLGSKTTGYDCPYVIQVNADESQYYKGSYNLLYTVVPRSLTVKAKNQEVIYGNSAQSGKDYVEVTEGSLLDGHSISAAAITETDNVLSVTEGSVTIQDTSGTNMNKYYTISYATGATTSVPATPDLGKVSQAGIIYDSTELSDVKLSAQKTSVAGTLKLKEGQTLTVGTNDYIWVFTPDDNVNYKTATGTVSLEVTKDRVEELQTGGTLVKSEYVYGDEFSIEGLTVTAVYTSGRTEDVTSLVEYDTSLTIDQTGVTLSYQEEGSEVQTCTVDITVDKKLLTIGAYVKNREYDGTNVVVIEKVFLEGIEGDDEVSVDAEGLTGNLESSMYNYTGDDYSHYPEGYKQVYLEDLTLSGSNKDNYVLPQDGYVGITDEDGNAGAMFITKRTLTVKVLDQTIVEGKKLNSTKYEVEGLLPGHVLGNVTLVAENEDGEELDSSKYTPGLEATITIKDFYYNVKVMEEGTPYIVTSYYDMIHVDPEPGTLKVVASCETHDFENGFCSVCDTYEEPTLKDGIYQIDNAGKLFWFAAVVNEGYLGNAKDNTISAVLTADIVVTPDIEGNQRVWIPIGVVGSVEYKGTFDGDFHTISGLYNSGEMQYLGLVGDNSGTVKKVGVINSYFSSSVQQASVGGVVSQNFGTVSCCWFTGTVETSKYNASLGGVVGYNGLNSVVENCYNAGTVTSSYDGGDEVRVGGVVGWNWGATVKNCYNVGTVSSAGTGGTNKNMVGSIVGYNYGSSYGIATAKNCYSSGELKCIGYNGYAYNNIVEENIENFRDFVSGEVAYLLNDSSSTGVWKQNLGVDQYPVLTGTAVVYQVKNCANVSSYSNEDVDLDHVSGDDGKCTACGEKLTCNITFNGMNVRSDGVAIVATNNAYSATLTAAEGYDLPEKITVTIGGSNYENFTYSAKDGKLTIPEEDVTDDIVITAEGVLHVHKLDENNKCSCGISFVAAVYTDAADDEPEYFATLTSAIEAVKSSTSADTMVKLLQDVDLGSGHLTIKAGVFSLDLNGKTLSSSDDKTIYMNGSGVELTVKDNGTGGKLDNAGILIDAGVLNVNSGIVSVITNQGGKVSINGGTIGTVKGKYGEITIAGGTINGAEKAVYVEGGTVNITDGQIAGAGVYATGGEVNIIGGTITGDKIDVYCDGAAVTFGIGENSVGAVFPGGITIGGTDEYANLNGYLADDASYWMGAVQKIPEDADITITDGDVQVKQKVVYTVSFTGTNVSSDGVATVLKDCEYKAALTAEEGYQLPESITVEIGGTAVSGYTYENGILTIPSSMVTDNINIIAVGAVKTYTVSIVDGEGKASDSVKLSDGGELQHGKAYQVTLSSDVGSDIVLENVKVAGEDISESVTFDESSHVLIIPAELVTGNIVISADATVVITINGNGGTCTNNYFADKTEVKITSIYGKDYSVEQLQFEKTGYTCTGINTQADGKGTAYALDAELTATEDTELFMQWQVNEHELTWILDGEEKEPVNVAYGEALPELEDPEKEGYSFVKWTGDTVPATMPDEDITIELTSEWKVNTYTISYYDSKDAEEPLSSESIAYGDEMPDVSFLPEDGYEFLYWALADGTEYAIPETMPAMDLKLYATVKPQTYELTFEDGNTTWTEMQYTEAVYQKVGDVKPNTQKEGYTFEGWFDDDEKKYDENYIMPAHDVTFKAKWTIKSYTVTWMVNGTKLEETYEYGVTPSFKESTDRAVEGCTVYTFIGWDPQLTEVTKAATYTAIYSTETIHVGDAEGDRDHLCDTCGVKVGECQDNDNDNICDECGENMRDGVDSDDKPVVADKVDTSKPEEGTPVIDQAALDTIGKDITTVVDAILAGKVTSNVKEAVSDETIEKIKEELEAGKQITTEIKTEVVEEKDIDVDVVNKIKDELGETGKVAQFLNISVLVKSVAEDGTEKELGTLNVLSEKITVTIMIPDDLIKDGREFYIIRVHDGKAEKLDLTKNADGTYSFETDRFSIYTLAYEDSIETKVPVTGDTMNGMIYMFLIALAFVSFYYAKRKTLKLK